MDIENIYLDDNLKEIEVEYNNVLIKIKIKNMSWSKKNQILTECFIYNTDGNIKFNFDKYMKRMLQEMIVEAPWGPTNEIFLNRIKPDFGSKLEKLVPKAFEEMENSNFFVKE